MNGVAHGAVIIINDVVVVIATPLQKLCVIGPDLCADRLWLTEIHRGALHVSILSGRDGLRVGRGEAAGVDDDHMIQNVPASV